MITLCYTTVMYLHYGDVIHSVMIIELCHCDVIMLCYMTIMELCCRITLHYHNIITVNKEQMWLSNMKYLSIAVTTS